MMEKQPLTPAGVAEQVTALYQLSNPELEEQASLIDSDISSWILDNFDVTAEQDAFLSSVSGSYLEALAEQTARALRHRWPIVFISHTAENDGKTNKYIRSEERDQANAEGGRAESEHTGRLIIETGY